MLLGHQTDVMVHPFECWARRGPEPHTPHGPVSCGNAHPDHLKAPPGSGNVLGDPRSAWPSASESGPKIRTKHDTHGAEVVLLAAAPQHRHMNPLQNLVEWSDNRTVDEVVAAQGIDHGAACHLVGRGSVAPAGPLLVQLYWGVVVTAGEDVGEQDRQAGWKEPLTSCRGQCLGRPPALTY